MKTMTPPSQLIVRHAERFADQQLLLVNAPDIGVAEHLNVVATWNFHAGYHQQWQTRAGQHVFSTTPPATAATAALVWLPKEKQLAELVFAALTSILPTSAPVWFVGENRGGIKSIHKRFPESLETPLKIAVGNHSLLLASHVLKNSEFELNHYLQWTELPQPGQDSPLKLASYPGVFSFPGIDAGSAMLLQHLPIWEQGKVLDFACGHGVLGAWLQRQTAALEIDYLDVSVWALAAAEQTLAANAIRGQFVAADGLPKDLGRYDVIVSHPPFHTGIATDYDIGRQFLMSARQHLSATGELWLVANRFLPWPELLEAAFGSYQKVAVDNKFAVYRARNGGKSSRPQSGQRR